MAGVVTPPFDPGNITAGLLPLTTGAYDLGSSGKKWKDQYLSGNLSVAGTITGALNGLASAASVLATPRNINGVAFDGSGNITVTAAAGTLTGATLASGVTASSLTSVGTLTSLTLSGLLLTVASASGGSGLRLPHGAAPTSPTNGDVWSTTAGIFARINGATVGPFSSSTAAFDGNLAALLVVNPGGASDTGFPVTIRTKSYSQLRFEMPTTIGGSTFRRNSILTDSDGSFDLSMNAYVENWVPAGGYQWHAFDTSRNSADWALDSAGYACYYWRAAAADPAPSTTMFGPAHLEFHPAPGTPNVLRLNMPRNGEDLAFWLCPTTDGVTTEYMTIKAATGRIGIGTNSPLFQVTIRKDQASNTFMGVQNENTSGGAGILVGTAAAVFGIFYIGSAVAGGDASSAMMRGDSGLTGGLIIGTGAGAIKFRPVDLQTWVLGTNGDLTADATNGGKLVTKASSSGGAGFRLPHGAAPSSPVDGDEWTTTAGKFIRINGTTKTFTLT